MARQYEDDLTIFRPRHLHRERLSKLYRGRVKDGIFLPRCIDDPPDGLQDTPDKKLCERFQDSRRALESKRNPHVSRALHTDESYLDERFRSLAKRSLSGILLSRPRSDSNAFQL